MKLFYGVYLEDLRLSACLDLIRLLGEPEYYRRCHLTIRGPYERHLPDTDIERFNRTLTEAYHSVRIESAGSFFFFHVRIR